MKSQTILSIGNIVALTIALTVNALANILPINGMNTGQISALFPSLFTPAGFTFSIWSIIYLLLIAFAVGQFSVKDRPYFRELSLWFLLSCAANASWILVWHHLFTAASVVVMLLLLYSLTQIFLLLEKNTFSRTEWFVIKLPFLFYLSWVCVATIANISTLLISLNWHGGFFSEEYWTVAMIIVAALLGVAISFRFNEPAFLAVLIWAFFGIYSRWTLTDHALIAHTASIAAIVLAIAMAKQLFTATKHSNT